MIDLSPLNVLIRSVPGGAAAPEYSSGEIGVVDSKTVEITFTEDVTTTTTFAAGVTILVGSASYSIASTNQDGGNNTVRYVLTSGVDGTEAVTWAYSESAGGIVGLADVSAQAVTNTAFEPGDLSGTILWWHARPSAANGISGANDEEIGTWDENGGASGNQYGQTTVDKKPLLKTGANGINGQNALFFDGTDDLFTSTIDFNTAFTTTAQTVWIVMDIGGFGADTDPWDEDGLVCEETGYWGLAVNDDQVVYWDYSGELVMGSIQLINTTYVVEFRHDSGSEYFNINSGTEVNRVFGGSGAGSNLRVGANRASAYFEGKIAEIIFSDIAESSVDRAKMQAVLENIYGVV